MITEFTYSLPAAGPCPGDQAVITISVVTTVTAGNDSQGNICTGDIIDLNTLLNGADAGGIFTENTSSGALNGSVFNTSGLSGIFSFTYTVGDGITCPQDQSIITINVNRIPEPIAGPDVEVCNFYILPIINGNNLTGSEAYYTLPQGGGDSFSEGDTLFSGGTLYLYDDTGICSGEDTLTVNINSTPIYSSLSITCDDATNTYTVRFTIEEGDINSYMVNGVLLGSDVFISDPIPSGAPYIFIIEDANGCGNTTLSGSQDCGCSGIDAGTLDPTPLRVCEDATAIFTPNNDEVLRNGDVLIFVLHDGDANNLGNILASNPIPEFNFTTGLQYGVTYYVTAIAGTDDGNGNVDFSDPCLSISEGVPLVFDPQVIARLEGEATICPGDTTTLTLRLNGSMAIDIIYSDGSQRDTLFSVGDTYQWQVSPSVTTTYELLDILNSGSVCNTQIPSSTVTVSVSDLNASMQVDSDFNGYDVSCENAKDGALSVAVSGGSAPYTYQWSNGATVNQIENLGAATYTVILTDANGCVLSLEETLEAPLAPEVFSTEIAPTCFGGENGLVLLDSIVSDAALSISLDGIQFEPITNYPVVINNLAGGAHQLFIRENDNCITALSFVLTEPTIRIVELGTGYNHPLG